MKKTLIFGYGNLDREDDGVAWHVLARIARHYHRPVPNDQEDELVVDTFEPTGENPDLMFRLQLMPEMADELAAFERVCFIDAHTGAVPLEVNIQEVTARFQNSPLTHHLTPQSLVEIMNRLYDARPQCLLVSVRGYSFQFSRKLSERTNELADMAAEEIIKWIEA